MAQQSTGTRPLPGHVRAPSGAPSRRSRLGAGPRFLPQRGLSPGAATVSQLLAGGHSTPGRSPDAARAHGLRTIHAGAAPTEDRISPGAGHFEEVQHLSALLSVRPTLRRLAKRPSLDEVDAYNPIPRNKSRALGKY